MASRHLGAAPDLAPTPSSGGVTNINVTPLLDVLLVLLLVGFVSLGLSRRSVAVTLPPPNPGQGSPVPVVLELTDDGNYRLNQQPVPGDQLSPLLSAIFSAQPGRVLFIKTAEGRTYQDLISATDLARAAGVGTIALVGAGPGAVR